MRGGKKTTTIKYHTHRTLHMSTTSRDAIPRGENKNKNQSPHPPRQLRLNGPKNIITHDFNTQPSSLRSPPPPPPPTPPNDGPHIVRREQVGFYTIHTHTHTTIHIIPRTFHGTGKNSPAHAKFGRIHKHPLFSKFQVSISSVQISLVSFHIFHGPAGTAKGERANQGVHRHFGVPFFNFSHIFISFQFSSFLDLLLICTFLGQTFLTGVSI